MVKPLTSETDNKTHDGPALYDSPAFTMGPNGSLYMAASAYHDGFIKEGQVYKLTPVDTEEARASVCNLFRPEEPCRHKELRKAAP